VAVGGGACAVNLTKGEHTVRFYYVPDGFVIGVAAFTVSVLFFVFMWICTSKKMREKAFAKPVVWLFTPTLYEKKPKITESEADAENSDTEVTDSQSATEETSEADSETAEETEIPADISEETAEETNSPADSQ